MPEVGPWAATPGDYRVSAAPNAARVSRRVSCCSPPTWGSRATSWGRTFTSGSEMRTEASTSSWPRARRRWRRRRAGHGRSDRVPGDVRCVGFFFSPPKRIVEVGSRHRLSEMFDASDFVAHGGLMSYGTDLRDLFRRAAIYVDKIPAIAAGAGGLGHRVAAEIGYPASHGDQRSRALDRAAPPRPVQAPRRDHGAPQEDRILPRLSARGERAGLVGGGDVVRLHHPAPRRAGQGPRAESLHGAEGLWRLPLPGVPRVRFRADRGQSEDGARVAGSWPHRPPGSSSPSARLRFSSSIGSPAAWGWSSTSSATT